MSAKVHGTKFEFLKNIKYNLKLLLVTDAKIEFVLIK